MNLLSSLPHELAWPLALLAAWVCGEFAHHRIRLPRISAYAVVGFCLAPTQLGLLPHTSDAMLLLANIAFGLVLFESGHRINLRWLRTNWWIAITSIGETLLTFCVVYALARWFNLSTTVSALLAALAMATSPATIVRVIDEQRSSGQVTERTLHLSVFDSVLAVLAFKIIVGLQVFETSGSLTQATYSSLVVLSASAGLGMLAGLSAPVLVRIFGRVQQDSTLAFAIAVIVLVALTHSLRLSPVLATLTFGLVARHRRMVMSPSQRGFGTLGDLLCVLLFTFIAASLEWQKVLAGIGLGFAIIAARCLAKIVGVMLFAHASGISWKKGLWVGLAMTPISAFVILVLEQTRHLGINLVDQLAPLAAAALVLEVLGPFITQRALQWAGETLPQKES